MKKNNNVKCVVCGNGYHLCRSCKDKLAIAPYKLVTDTSEHYKVYQVVNAYRSGVYTKEEARKALLNVDMSDKETYLDSVKKILDEICKVEEVKTFRDVRKNSKPIAINKNTSNKISENKVDKKIIEDVKSKNVESDYVEAIIVKNVNKINDADDTEK